MNLLSVRQKLIVSNIANTDTPGYKTQDIDFHFEFMSAATGEQPQVLEASGLRTKNDGNNVSMDRETRLLSETAIRFNMATQLLRSQVRAIRSAIQEGKGA